MLIRDYTDLLDSDYPESILIAADWLEEQGRYQESLSLRSGQLLPETSFCLGGYGFGSGYSIGYGRGYSSGFGYGYGFGFGRGFGYGHGRGINPALVPSNYLALSSHANS